MQWRTDDGEDGEGEALREPECPLRVLGVCIRMLYVSCGSSAILGPRHQFAPPSPSHLKLAKWKGAQWLSKTWRAVKRKQKEVTKKERRGLNCTGMMFVMCPGEVKRRKMECEKVLD